MRWVFCITSSLGYVLNVRWLVKVTTDNSLHILHYPSIVPNVHSKTLMLSPLLCFVLITSISILSLRRLFLFVIYISLLAQGQSFACISVYKMTTHHCSVFTTYDYPTLQIYASPMSLGVFFIIYLMALISSLIPCELVILSCLIQNWVLKNLSF